MKIAIIGFGAAGFFSAITAKENYPDDKVVIFEKSKKLLGKVKISGGGRCNITNGCTSIKELSAAYPRGGNALNKAFEKLDLSQEHKGICGDNICDFGGEPCKYEEDIQNENLKSCPFCHTRNLGVSASWVFCHNCNATGPVGDARFEGRELWNSRFDEKMTVEA